MAARISDYVKAIQTAKSEAYEMKKQEIVIRAGDLHRQINKGTPTLVTCCMAMKKMMLEDDEFILNPETKSQASSDLTIRYYVHDLQHRLPLLKAKKRGRKKGSRIEKKEEPKSSIQLTLEDWLSKIPLYFEEEKSLYAVQGTYGIWKIKVAVPRGRRPFDLDDVVYQLLKYADEGTDKYSVCMNDSKENRKQWDKISPILRTKMNLTALFVKNGEIEEI